MYAVTWLFQGSKQKSVYGDVLKAESRARELRRLGCKKVKVAPEKINGHKADKISVDEWPQIEEAFANVIESDIMANDIEDAKHEALKLRQQGMTKDQITQYLNDKYEAVFFFNTQGIYARNEPDYLPERKIISC